MSYRDATFNYSMLDRKDTTSKLIYGNDLFLDRDGTINIDNGYTHKIKDFKLIKNTLKILRRVSKKGHYIFIVTNQAGIAKGKFKLKDFYKLHDYIKKN